MDLEQRMRDLESKLDDMAEEAEALRNLPAALAELKGTVTALQALIIAQTTKVEKATSLGTAIQFAAVVIVPLLVALIGGYFVLRTAGIPVGSP